MWTESFSCCRVRWPMTMTVPANTLRTQIDNDSPRWAPCKAKQIPRKRINHLGIASECAKFAYIVKFAARKKAKRERLPQQKGYQLLCISAALIPRIPSCPAGYTGQQQKRKKPWRKFRFAACQKVFTKLFRSAFRHANIRFSHAHTHTHTYDCVCVYMFYMENFRVWNHFKTELTFVALWALFSLLRPPKAPKSPYAFSLRPATPRPAPPTPTAKLLYVNFCSCSSPSIWLWLGVFFGLLTHYLRLFLTLKWSPGVCR